MYTNRSTRNDATTHVQLKVSNKALGLAVVARQTDPTRMYTVCLGDHSCECEYMQQQSGVCKHLEALALECSFTHKMRQVTAAYLLKQGKLRPADSGDTASNDSGLFICNSIAADGITYTCSAYSSFCDCLDWSLHGGTCCHLLAVAEHPALTSEQSISDLATSVDGQSSAAIPVRRSFPEQQPAMGITTGSQIISASGMQAELDMLLKSATREGAVKGRSELSEDHKQCMRVLRHLSNSLAALDRAAVEEILPLLLQAQAINERCAPAYLSTQRVAQKQDARQDKDRTHKPLFHRKRKQQGNAEGPSAPKKKVAAAANGRSAGIRIVAAAIAHARKQPQSKSAGGATKRFMPMQPQGRPSTSVRTLQSREHSLQCNNKFCIETSMTIHQTVE
jgi:hypothetical protein